jgi:hypothetical protein
MIPTLEQVSARLVNLRSLKAEKQRELDEIDERIKRNRLMQEILIRQTARGE